MAMVNKPLSCEAPKTIADKLYTYNEYYIGEKDQEKRKHGYGRHHWSGAQSLECYDGHFLRDTMHGLGEYRYRHRGPESLALTYEGHFYNNSMHGYGLMSYADGRVFNGIYHSNLRWGPGIESYSCLHENVGLWQGARLIRLSWKPLTHNVVPDLLSTSIGRNIAAQNRSILITNTKTIGEVNPALELLKQHGATPLSAAQMWIKLYPRNCTDPKSQMYHADVFDRAYYDDKVDTLELFTGKMEDNQGGSQDSDSTVTPKDESSKFYAWNNNELPIHMMKHCYQLEKQRRQIIKLEEVLNGPRLSFKPAAQHELDCRTVLMASYLGHIRYVAQLINENDVQPNIADIQGNTALIYAACGSHPDIIHFLVEAGAHVDDYNDACCTPLGIALINYVCLYWDIPANRVLEAILPPDTTFPETEEIINEWKIERDINGVSKTPSNKTIRGARVSITKKPKSTLSSGSLKTNKQTPLKDTKHVTTNQTLYDEMCVEDKQLYLNIDSEYNSVVNDLFSNVGGTAPIQCLFEINDMVKDIDMANNSEEQKKSSDKKDLNGYPKALKETRKLSKEMISYSLEKKLSLDSKEKMKFEQMDRIMRTIIRLLLDGADPKRVCCPWPALCFAIISCSPPIVRELVKSGADVNEVYPQILGYTSLDIAISGELTKENLDITQILLEGGANANHLLPIDESGITGPTLLHAVLAKKISDNDGDQEIRDQLLDLLLGYGSDPIAQYKGQSAVDVAMSKHSSTFDILTENSHTDLNAIINDSNQTILVKMFHLPYCKSISVTERTRMLTNLLLYGADPLLKCQNGDETYDNLLVYINSVLLELDKSKSVAASKQDQKTKSETKAKKNEKPKAIAQTAAKPGAKVASGDDIGDYKQTLNVVRNCARLLFIRWIQAQLLKEIIQVVDKYKHRHWNMILKEYKNGYCSGLWLNPERCLEIWDVLKTTRKQIYNDKRHLKYVLCIVIYYFKNVNKCLKEPKVSSKEKSSIESEVASLIREHTSGVAPQVLKRPYVTPELTSANEVAKFNICFECAMPLTDANIQCDLCKLVDFCSLECMAENVERDKCHPCSGYLKNIYFPTPQQSVSGHSNELLLN